MYHIEQVDRHSIDALSGLDDVDDIRELTSYEQQLVNGGDFSKALGSFGLAGGIGMATFGSGWGSVGVGLAFFSSPIAVVAMGGLALYGGYQFGRSVFDW